jgi:hypothetical protein
VTDDEGKPSPERRPRRMTDREFLAHMLRSYPLFSASEMVAELVEWGWHDLSYLLRDIDVWE